jgi:sugar lactone lactonase YvrE
MIRRFVSELFFRPAVEELRYLPEGPRVLRNYPGDSAKLGWVAIQHASGALEGSFNVLDLESGANMNFPLRGRPGFFAETAEPGVVLVGLERKLALLDVRTGRLSEAVAHIDAHPGTIINDGLAVDGGVLFGTKDLEFKRPIAALYFFDPVTHRVHTVLDGQTCSNGKYLRREAAGATLIDIDSAPKRIGCYRLDGKLERVLEARLVRPAEALPAFPDGLRPAPEGRGEQEGASVIVAYYNPAEVSGGLAQQIRVSDGEVVCEWTIPGSPRVTCPEFVKLNGKVKLLFTTAVEGMPPEIRRQAPGAGCMYIADTDFEALPAAPPLVPVQRTAEDAGQSAGAADGRHAGRSFGEDI